MRKLRESFKTLFNNSKNKTIIKNASGAFIIKGAGLLISFFSVPLYIKYFNNQALLGLWYTILSVLVWILNFDLGIGNGLRNELVKSLETNDEELSKKYISTAYLVVTAISGVIIIVGLLAAFLINWNSFFNIDVSTISLIDLRNCILISFSGLMLQLILRLANSIIYALQKSVFNNFLSLIASFSQLLFLLIYKSGNSVKSLYVLSIVQVLTVNVPLLIATFLIFSKKLKFAKPSFKFFDKPSVKKILGIGILFLYCQIMYMLLISTNEFLITKLTRPDNVVDYNIYFKLFSLVGMLVMLALTPLWSMVTKAQAEEDYIWLKKTFKVLIFLGIIAAVGQFLIVPLLPIIMKVWLGDKAIQINYGYAFIFAAFGAIFTMQNIVATVVCGLGRMKTQAIFYTVAVIVKIILAVLFVKENNWILIVFLNFAVLVPYVITETINIIKYFNKSVKKGEI